MVGLKHRYNLPMVLSTIAGSRSSRVRRVHGALVTDLRRQTDSHGPLPRFRNRHARPDMIADPLPADPRIRAGEDVKSQVEPVAEAVSDFERFVQLVFGGILSVDDGLAAFEGKIAVKLEHCDARPKPARNRTPESHNYPAHTEARRERRRGP